MKTQKSDIDSLVFGRNVLSLQGLTSKDDLLKEESTYRRTFDPVYVSCRVPMEDLAVIHVLEKHGFELVECQIRSKIRFKQVFDTSQFPYRYERVTSQGALDEVLKIAARTVVHDRFSTDSAVPRGISGERYRRYVEQSFRKADEAVWRLYDPVAERTLNFRTHRITGPGEALLLLGGVHPDFKGLGLGVIASHFCFNEFRREGIRHAITHISAINYPIFNLEIGSLGFRVDATFAVLRKVYS